MEPERGRTFHGVRLHEDLIRIPLLIGGAGIASASIEEPVSLVDIAPTLLELLDVRPDGHLAAR